MLEYCADEAGYRLDRAEQNPRTGLFLSYVETVPCKNALEALGPDRLGMPCATAKAIAGDQVCDEPGSRVALDLTKYGRGYSTAILYVTERERIREALELVPSIFKTKAHSAGGDGKAMAHSVEVLRIHPAYEDLKRRFGFLTDLIETLALPLGLFFLFFFLILSFAQIGLLLDRRKRAYGILLAQGVAPRDIYLLPTLQVGLCFLLAFLGAELVVATAAFGLNEVFDGMVAAKGYAETLVAGRIDLLPVPWEIHAMVLLGGLVTLMGMVLLRVRRMRLHGRWEPATMITS